MPVTLTQVQSMNSLMRSYKWDIGFPTIPTMLQKYLEAAGASTLAKEINIRAISAGVPKARIEEVQAAPRGIDLHEPGLVHLDGQIQFQLVETTDLITRKFIYGLRQLNMSDIYKVQQDITSSLKSENSQRLDVLLSRLDNKNRVVWQYLCCKCFIMDYDDPQLDGQSGAVTPSLTLQFNYFVDGEPGFTDNYKDEQIVSKITEKLSGTDVSSGALRSRYTNTVSYVG